MPNSPILVIAGCTASGKSDIALSVARSINGVIINADSRQVYREMSIGTAKPMFDYFSNNIGYIDGVPHYLYSYVSVSDDYNVYQYQKDVFDLLDNLPNVKVPILVGGTGLYIDSVVFNYELKEDYINNFDKKRESKLYELPLDELQKLVDKDIFIKLNNSDKNNPRRLVRIIEMSENGNYSKNKGNPLEYKYFVVDKPVDEIRKNIENRVNHMIDNGLMEENVEIREQGLNKYNALMSIGYQEFDGCFEGSKSLDEVRNEIINHTNQYAKRQRTWFRRNKDVVNYIDSARDIIDIYNSML